MELFVVYGIDKESDIAELGVYGTRHAAERVASSLYRDELCLEEINVCSVKELIEFKKLKAA